jgi:hypothetical protein
VSRLRTIALSLLLWASPAASVTLTPGDIVGLGFDASSPFGPVGVVHFDAESGYAATPVSPVTGVDVVIDGASALVLQRNPTTGAGTIVRVDLATGASTTVATGLQGVGQIEVDGAGRIFVGPDRLSASFGTPAIYRVDPVTGAATLLHTAANLRGVALGPDGVYSTNIGGIGPIGDFLIDVLRIDPDTGATSVLESPSFFVPDVFSIEVDGLGNRYLWGDLGFFDGDLVRTFGSPAGPSFFGSFEGFSGTALDEDGNPILTRSVPDFFSQPFITSSHVSFGPTDVFASAIDVYVPEPRTLLLVGMGLTGLAVLRRRRA